MRNMAQRGRAGGAAQPPTATALKKLPGNVASSSIGSRKRNLDDSVSSDYPATPGSGGTVAGVSGKVVPSRAERAANRDQLRQQQEGGNGSMMMPPNAASVSMVHHSDDDWFYLNGWWQSEDISNLEWMLTFTLFFLHLYSILSIFLLFRLVMCCRIVTCLLISSHTVMKYKLRFSGCYAN